MKGRNLWLRPYIFYITNYQFYINNYQLKTYIPNFIFPSSLIILASQGGSNTTSTSTL